ncbi:hypothetical protein ACNVED_05100 [Legionella sp. D16C41]|uniref:hypothetical protein n=1 Tax=Legionella sp. D16C41 TaxID=3402688 RepID=UPI003AF9B09E
MQTLEEYKIEVSRDWRKLRAIPTHLILQPADYFSLYKSAVEQSPEALTLVSRSADTNKISNEQLEIYLIALNHRYFTSKELDFLPMPNISTAQRLTENQLKLLEKAAAINHLAVLEPLSQISPANGTLYSNYLTLLRRLIDKDDEPQLRENIGFHLPFHGTNFSKEEEDTYIAFARKYPDGIRNVHNDAIKSFMIKKLGLEHFLKSDLTLMSVVPAEYQDDAELLVKELLKTTHVKGKTNLVITPPFLQDNVKEAYESYSEEKHSGQCVRLSSLHFETVREVLAMANDVIPNMRAKLVLMGPTLSTSTKIANVEPSQIAACIETYRGIQEVVLMGYNTAGLKGSAEDKEGLLGRVANEFKERDIKGVTVKAYTGDGFSHAKKPDISSPVGSPAVSFFSHIPSSESTSPVSETSRKVKFIS